MILGMLLTHTQSHTPLSPSSIIWYLSAGSDTLQPGR